MAEYGPIRTPAKYKDCMYNNFGSKFFVLGVFIGTPIGMVRKQFWPLIVGAAIGTYADYAFAYKECNDVRADFQSSLVALKKSKNNPHD